MSKMLIIGQSDPLSDCIINTSQDTTHPLDFYFVILIKPIQWRVKEEYVCVQTNCTLQRKLDLTNINALLIITPGRFFLHKSCFRQNI